MPLLNKQEPQSRSGAAEPQFGSIHLLQQGAVAMPETADLKAGTIDCVWYTGVAVPRQDGWSDPYMLRLDMSGCRMDRLNAGAPIFDTHLNGSDWKSVEAGQTGTKAQRGVVLKAWSEGAKGLATLKFDLDDPDGAELFRKVSSGIVRNLSPGVTIYNKTKEIPAGGLPKFNGQEIDQFVATDWEPFELSPCPVPADFDTTFLSGFELGGARATSPKETAVAEPTQAGGGARVDQAVLDAKLAEGITLERERVKGITELAKSFNMEALGQKLIADGTCTLEAAKQRFATASEIKGMGAPMLKHGLKEEFLNGLVETCTSADQARKQIFEQLAVSGQADLNGKPHPIHTEVAVTRDGLQTQFGLMESALLLRVDRRFGLAKKLDINNQATAEYLSGCGPEAQKQLEERGREYQGMTLMEMARQSLELQGIRTRGMSKMEIATRALITRPGSQELFSGGGGMETSSDFPGILANVANKTLRQAYESYPQTFKPFCRQATATDFKPINRAQLNDLYALPKMNEKGEFHRAILTDSTLPYQLAPYGGIVAITRKAIINDDLQAFTRVSMELGRAASTTQSNTVWGIITANTQVMQDGLVLFHATHKNLMTGAGSAFSAGLTTPPTGLTLARAMMRQQKGPGGTPLNLVTRYLCVGTNLETPAAQAVYPVNIASADVTKVVPEWIRSLVVITEPRLDPASGTTYPWLVVADPAQIDTIEYCFLEGQEGVYFETRQGFEVDGVEMKARMDFAAAAIEQRGMVYAAGA